MKHGSLFSGIGGFDLAAEWMGWDNVFHCEWEEFPRKILNYYWPNAISYGDITTTDFTVHRGKIDILTGGFPCQPYSAAGKRLGTEDDRHLWPEMLRAIREIKPRWVVGENVSGLLSWNEGVVFEEVQTDLEAEGYEVQSFVLPAASVGAPHRRDRVWIVAHADERDDGRTTGEDEGACGQERLSERHEVREPAQPGEIRGNASNSPSNRRERQGSGVETEEGLQPGPATAGELSGGPEGLCRTGNVTNTGHERPQGSEKHRSPEGVGTEPNEQPSRFIRSKWQNFPTQPPVRSRNDGLSRRLVRYLTQEVYDEISKTSEENRIKDVLEMWEKIQSPEVWEKIRGLYSLESKEILLQTMQLYSGADKPQDNISPFSENVSGRFLQSLRKHGEFRCSPQGQKLQKQRSEEPRNSLSFLPHEVALAAWSFETAITKFDAWHRNESIKGYGNAIVPQVALQIFKAIQQYEATP